MTQAGGVGDIPISFMAQEANDEALVDQLHEQLDDVYKLCTQEDCAQISASWTVQLKRCHEIFEASREYRATLEEQAAADASSIEG